MKLADKEPKAKETQVPLIKKIMQRRLSSTPLSPEKISLFVNEYNVNYSHLCKDNIEKFIGTTSIPIGLAGPLAIHGEYAKGNFYIPLATTEGALVASYNRGANVITQSGGINTCVIDQGTTRAPVFQFPDLLTAKQFIIWVKSKTDKLKQVGEATTRYGKLKDIQIFQESCYVFLIISFTTNNASGQNMVTIASHEMYQYILKYSPYPIENSILESNFSSDKKASYQTLLGTRGRKVSGEVMIPNHIVKKYLNTTIEAMARTWRIVNKSSQLAGYHGVHGHIANAIAAIYVACGQDIACVSESTIGYVDMQNHKNEYLYCSITMPNIIVGSVGGGTKLPTQKACLEIMTVHGEEPESANRLAEIILATCLAGEISLTAAISAEEFARAHLKHGRSYKIKA